MGTKKLGELRASMTLERLEEIRREIAEAHRLQDEGRSCVEIALEMGKTESSIRNLLKMAAN